MIDRNDYDDGLREGERRRDEAHDLLAVRAGHTIFAEPNASCSRSCSAAMAMQRWTTYVIAWAIYHLGSIPSCLALSCCRYRESASSRLPERLSLAVQWPTPARSHAGAYAIAAERSCGCSTTSGCPIPKIVRGADGGVKFGAGKSHEPLRAKR